MPVDDVAAGPRLTVEAGMRLYIDLTPALRDPFGRELPERVMGAMEFRSQAIFAKLLEDPRLAPRGSASRSRLIVLRKVLRTRAPQTAVRALLWPDATRERLLREVDAAITRVRVPAAPSEQLQRDMTAFLARYGHRAIAEIDLGLPRWSEDPAHLLGAIANYQRLDEAALAPDAQFARGAREADAMIATLVSRVHGPRRLLVRFLLRRVRLLGGLREQPKFQIMRIFAIGRAMIAPVGASLAERGLLDGASDVYFLPLPEARLAVGGGDKRAIVAERRATYRRELARRRIPRVLLSDGTDAETVLPAAADGAIRGTPASPGVARGVARVIPSPPGARLEPGEVLVAPSTDPGWTPLFLTASALVMEMGGRESHGPVVARGYGVPAVLGGPGATDRQ